MAWIMFGGDALRVSDAGRLVCESEGRRGKELHALWDDGGITRGQKKYYELDIVKLQNCQLWFGATTKKHFGHRPRKFNGLFLGGPGNTSDGLALMTGKFVPKAFQEGDHVGMEVTAGDALIVSFYVNYVYAGEAFRLREYPANEVLLPAVSVDVNGRGQSAAELSMISAPEAPPARQPAEPDAGSLAGEWKAVGAEFGNCIPRLNIEQTGEGKYRFGMKCANSLTTQVEIGPNGAKSGHTMATMMMPMPPWRDIEKRCSSLLGGLSDVTLTDGRLKLSSGSDSIEFARSADGPKPPCENVSSFK